MHNNCLYMHARDAPWKPDFSGHSLEELRKRWVSISADSTCNQFPGIQPVSSIALIGAIRDQETKKMNLRDEIMCNAVMNGFTAAVPISPACTVDLYTLSEHTDAFETKRTYDMAIFCNLRDIPPNLIHHYRKKVAKGGLKNTLQMDRQPFVQTSRGDNLNRRLADALEPSDILAGRKYVGVSQEHTFYMTVSPKAFEPHAYRNLAKNLKAKYVVAWGFQGFIDGNRFISPSTYDLSRDTGNRLLQPKDYTLTQSNDCGSQLTAPYDDQLTSISVQTRHIHLAIRNDTLERIESANDQSRVGSNILFQNGIESIQKLRLSAEHARKLGEKPIVHSWNVAERCLTSILKKVSRPPNTVGQIERNLRNALRTAFH